MRTPGDILLISCYELGHQPIALASPLGFLSNSGFQPQALDLSVERLDSERVARARFIGISVPMHTALRIALRAIAEIRRLNPEAHLCLYGLYAWMNADFLLSQGVDSIIGGEFEAPLVKLVEALESRQPWEGLEGIGSEAQPSPPYLQRLSFSQLQRSGLRSLESYAKLEENGVQRLAGAVEASRGCRHLCRHCPIVPLYRGKFFVVPQEIVLQDIGELARQGATHITFSDPDFLNGPKHSLNIVRAMHRDFPNLSFDLTTKIEHILQHRGIFPELKALGCAFVISAVESLNDEVLANLKKGHNREDVVQALNTLRDSGITLRPSLVPFTPWETLSSYLGLLDWVAAEELVECVDPVHFSIRLLVPPGSALLEEASLRPFLGELDSQAFSYRWNHPDDKMEHLNRLVSMEIQKGIRHKSENLAIFKQIRSIAYRLAEKPLPREQNDNPSLPKPPRLTESWFCCAEPMMPHGAASLPD